MEKYKMSYMSIFKAHFSTYGTLIFLAFWFWLSTRFAKDSAFDDIILWLIILFAAIPFCVINFNYWKASRKISIDITENRLTYNDDQNKRKLNIDISDIEFVEKISNSTESGRGRTYGFLDGFYYYRIKVKSAGDIVITSFITKKLENYIKVDEYNRKIYPFVNLD